MSRRSLDTPFIASSTSTRNTGAHTTTSTKAMRTSTHLNHSTAKRIQHTTGTAIVRLLMAVPVVCWILFAVLWFKWVEVRIAFVLVVVCAPVFLVDVLDAMKGVSKDLRDMLRSFRPTRAQLFTKLVLPATVPAILTSWKINLSLAIRVVTIAELVGAVTGIGYGLVVAQELFSVADVFAWTLILVVILFLAEALLAQVEERVLRWRA